MLLTKPKNSKLRSKTMRRLDDREYRRLMNDPKVQEAMRYRCDEERHEFEGACSAAFQIYMECKWCGERR